MANIYLCGHGSWSKAGFVNLPKGTTFRVYTPVGRYLGLDQAKAILQGSAGALQSDQFSKEYESVADLTLHPAPEFATDFAGAAAGVAGQIHMVAVKTRLSDLLKTFAGHDLHWMACRVRFGGLDTVHGGLNEDYYPDTGVGVSHTVGVMDSIRSKKTGSKPAVVSAPGELASNPAFNKAKNRAGL